MKKILLVLFLSLPNLLLTQGLQRSTTPPSGTFGFWNRTGGTVGPTTVNDSLSWGGGNKIPSSTLVQTFPYDRLTLKWSADAMVFRIYVSPDGDNSDGLTWATAFNEIQSAIDVLPKNLNGYQAYILIKAGGTYNAVTTIGFSNGLIYFLWAGSFVDNANTPGTYSYWVRNEAINPIGNDEPIIIQSTNGGSAFKSESNTALQLFIQSINYDYAWNQVGFGYWGRIIFQQTVATYSPLIGLFTQGATLESEAGIILKLNNLNRYTPATLSSRTSDAINLFEFEIQGAVGSCGDYSGTQWDGVLAQGTQVRGLASIAYASGFGRPTTGKPIEVTGVKQLYSDNNLPQNNATLNFSLMNYNAGYLGSNTPIVRVGAGYGGAVTYSSSNVTFQDYSTSAHKVTVDGTTTIFLSPKISETSSAVNINASLKLKTGAVIDSIKVVNDSLKFYIGGSAYTATKD